MEKYLPYLLELAEKSYKNGDIPVSCIILKDDEIVSFGYNDRFYSSHVTGHAEINAITMAEESIHDFRLNGYIMLTTLKPCDMCFEVIEASRIDKIYYILDQKTSKSYPQDKYIQNYFPGNNFVEKYEKLFNDFFKKIR